MIIRPVFMQSFDVKIIADRMLHNGEPFRLWQVNHLREKYHPNELSEYLQNFLDRKSFRNLYPKRGRPPAVLTNEELTRRVGIMIYYPLFLAEERARAKMSPKPEGTASERACERLAVKYGFWRARRTLPDLMTKWRKDEMFMRIVDRYRTRLSSEI